MVTVPGSNPCHLCFSPAPKLAHFLVQASPLSQEHLLTRVRAGGGGVGVKTDSPLHSLRSPSLSGGTTEPGHPRSALRLRARLPSRWATAQPLVLCKLLVCVGCRSPPDLAAALPPEGRALIPESPRGGSWCSAPLWWLRPARSDTGRGSPGQETVPGIPSARRALNELGRPTDERQPSGVEPGLGGDSPVGPEAAAPWNSSRLEPGVTVPACGCFCFRTLRCECSPLPRKKGEAGCSAWGTRASPGPHE